MSAFLEDALRALLRHRGARNMRGRRLFREAESSPLDEDPDVPVRFGTVCDALDLDPEFLRSMLRGLDVSRPPGAAPRAASWRRSPPCRSVRGRSNRRRGRASAS